MESPRINAIATSMIAFSTFLAGLFAMLYYIYQIKEIGFAYAIFYSEVYILLNLTFLYTLKRWWLE